MCLAVDTFRNDSGAEVVSAEGINSQAPRCSIFCAWLLIPSGMTPQDTLRSWSGQCWRYQQPRRDGRVSTIHTGIIWGGLCWRYQQRRGYPKEINLIIFVGISCLRSGSIIEHKGYHSNRNSWTAYELELRRRRARWIPPWHDRIHAPFLWDRSYWRGLRRQHTSSSAKSNVYLLLKTRIII